MCHICAESFDLHNKIKTYSIYIYRYSVRMKLEFAIKNVQNLTAFEFFKF